MLKAAIIGCGAIAQVHKQVLLSLPEAKLVACCDKRPERAEEFAASCNLRAYSDLEAMLDEEQPDVVHLCVPHPLHTPLAVLCVKRGIHVFTEKPPAKSTRPFPTVFLTEKNPSPAALRTRLSRILKRQRKKSVHLPSRTRTCFPISLSPFRRRHS